jgi:hypothetical protein
MHDEVKTLRKARDERIEKAKSRQPDANSPKERISRMGLNVRIKHEGDIDEQ